MKLLFLLFLLGPSLALDLDPEPRKPNIVTKHLGDYLDDAFQNLTTKGLTVPLLDLNNFQPESGNFSNVTTTASGLTKYLDGVGSHGFQMRVNVSTAVVCGNYHLVYLDVPYLFPFFGKGNFSVEVDAISVDMTLKATRNYETNKFDFNLTEFNVSVQSSKVKFDNLMYDPGVADFLNELLGNLVPQLVPVIAEVSKKYVLPGVIDKYGNGIFDCLKEDNIKKCINDLFSKGQNPFLELPNLLNNLLNS